MARRLPHGIPALAGMTATGRQAIRAYRARRVAQHIMRIQKVEEPQGRASARRADVGSGGWLAMVIPLVSPHETGGNIADMCDGTASRFAGFAQRFV
jgi:hypothetical protein